MDNMQAFVITAYQNPDYLSTLVNSITQEGNHAYVHIDAKSTMDVQDLTLNNPELVSVYKQYAVNWGGYNHLLAIIFLLKQIPDGVEYVHTISGQDALVRSKAQFDSFFSNQEGAFMSLTPLEDTEIGVQRRVEGYNLFPNADSRKPVHKILNRGMWLIRKALRMNKRQIGGFDRIYKGMIWVSLPYAQVKYVLQYIEDNPSYMKRLKHTLLPEEFFFQTILMNSPYKDTIVPHNLRYTLWIEKHGSAPAILDEKDYAGIIDSNCYFARKIVMPYSKQLLNLIEKARSAPMQHYSGEY